MINCNEFFPLATTLKLNLTFNYSNLTILGFDYVSLFPVKIIIDAPLLLQGFL